MAAVQVGPQNAFLADGWIRELSAGLRLCVGNLVAKASVGIFEATGTALCDKRRLNNDWFSMPVDVTADQSKCIRKMFLSEANGEGRPGGKLLRKFPLR